ncbi:MAG: AtpZ/AtpI family protein [Eubacterium sp.]|jgi:F0F1-type ATP synthase assembly protein I|nr:AtpZ/AtpI family protein [Eubacterium sp.]
MKYRKNVYQSFMMVMQFGINMIVPILMCTMLGVYIGKKFDMLFIVAPLFFIGALAGFRNIYRMAKKIFEQESDRDTKNVKKTK